MPLPVSQLVICLNFCIKVTLRVVLLQFNGKGTTILEFASGNNDSFVLFCSLKVYLTPKIFFAKTIKLILLSNLTEKFFDLVKSSNFNAPSKYVKMPPFWFATELNGAWVEDRL